MAEDAGYKTLMASMKLRPLTYKEVAVDWKVRPDEWFHAMIAVEDLPIVLSIPNLRIYAWYRCKLVENYGSEAHYHWHGLVHFSVGKFTSWKRQAHRVDVKFSSKKNTFKKIHCLDHAVGVLRYLSCKDGTRVGRRDNDGLVNHPHTHYARQPIEEYHRHNRGKDCPVVRNQISERIAAYLNLDEKANWNSQNLHGVLTLCM